MFTLRRSGERGHGRHGWLDARHTFSFADYHDPAWMGFGPLRVMNEDRVAPGRGFGTHPHRDMEIVTVVLEGALQHRDSMGHEAVLRPGEVQRITAGTGIEHSEVNPSTTEPVHLYQIWLLPDRRGHAPDYAQAAFDPANRKGRWQWIAGTDPGAISIHQDARIALADLSAEQPLDHAIPAGRRVWLQLLRGAATVGGQALAPGDGLAAAGESALHIVGGAGGAELMLFELP